MSIHRQILTIYFFSLVLQLYQLYNEEYEHWCENSTSSKPSDNVELMALINLYKAKRRRLRVWVWRRSNEWIKGTLRGLYLQDTEFEKTFRISRNSFEQLHALLGFQFNS